VLARPSFWTYRSDLAQLRDAERRSRISQPFSGDDHASETCHFATSRHSFAISFVSVSPYGTFITVKSLILHFFMLLRIVFVLIGKVAISGQVIARELSILKNLRVRHSVEATRRLKRTGNLFIFGMIPFCTIARRQGRLSILNSFVMV